MSNETDRELLELAAKAAGIDGKWSATIGEDWGRHEGKPGILVDGQCWNPLTDDGDAFRLQVRFRMILEHFDGLPNEVECLAYDGPRGADLRQAVDGDLASAYRRAIVRAAAEIGKQQTTEKD